MYKIIDAIHLNVEENSTSVKICLDVKNKHKLILKIANGIIEERINSLPTAERIKEALETLLTENDDFLLIRLIRLALGNEAVKNQLRARKTGVLIVDYIKWEKIQIKIEQEELEAILVNGISQ